MELKFRWKVNADDRRKSITRKIKSLLKEEPTLPDNLFVGYTTDFQFTTQSGKYRFYYAGGDTPKGGIFYIVSAK